MIYRARRLIKTSFVSVLRQVFIDDPVFPWNKNRLKTKIYINESFADGERKFPDIIVSDVSTGNFFSASYDRNFQTSVYDPETNEYLGERFGHNLSPTLNIQVEALSEFELGILADRIESFFEWGGVQKFRDAGITIQGISVSQTVTEPYGKNMIYRLVYTFNLYTEWETLVKPDDNFIEKIRIPRITILYGNKNNEQTWDDLQYENLSDESGESGESE